MNRQLDTTLLQEKVSQQFSNSLAPSFGIPLKRVLRLDPEFPHVYYNLGIHSFQLENYSRAERLFKRAVMMDPNFIAAHHNLGITFTKQNDFIQASKAFQQAIDLDPTSFPAYNAYGQTLFEMGDFHKAKEQFSKSLAKKPRDLNANNSMGLLLLIQQRYEEAIECFETAINHNKDETNALEYINLSMALFQQEKKEEALETFKKGMSLIDKAENLNDKRQDIIETYTRTEIILERKVLQMSDQKEKIDIHDTIVGIRWILGLMESMEGGRP